VLYQSGYLTITGYDDERGKYTLDFPNEEVRSSVYSAVLKYGQIDTDKRNIGEYEFSGE
jgi:hypothetical protein